MSISDVRFSSSDLVHRTNDDGCTKSVVLFSESSVLFPCTNYQVDKLKMMVGNNPPAAASPIPSNSAGNDPDNRSSLDLVIGIFSIEKSKMDKVEQALEELMRMASAEEPLWVKSVETGREILDYDEYIKEFSGGTQWPKRSIEASRDTVVVFMALSRLIRSFMDVNQFKEMFPCSISKATTRGGRRGHEGARAPPSAKFVDVVPLSFHPASVPGYNRRH